MNLKEVLIMSASMLDLASVNDALETIDADNEQTILIENEQVKKLFNLAIVSFKEICFRYLPIIAEHTLESSNKTILTSSLEDFVKIVRVKKDDKITSYKYKNGVISLDEDGFYTVEYIKNPIINSMLEDLSILNDFGPDILMFGICAYYTIGMGLYDEFEYYHNEYISRCESAKKLANCDLPARSWL